jgi:hypothetical protein
MLQQQKLKILSPADFAALGQNHVAYIKPVTVDDKPAYAIHGADGTSMGISTDRLVAFAAVRQNDLEPVDVH